MEREQIEQLLSGKLERHTTLAVCMKYRGRANCAYFYDLTGKEQLLQIRRGLQEAAAAAPQAFAAFPGMTHPYYWRPLKEDVDRDLVIRLQEDEEMLTLAFLPIMAVEYRKSFGGKIEPYLATGKAVYTLLIRKQCGHLYTSGRGQPQDFKVTWWFNKLCRRNRTARRIFLDLFEELGKTRYIFRDLARTLRHSSFILPPVTYAELQDFHTPRDLIRHFSQIDLGIDFNKMDINAAYYLVRLAEQISAKDRSLLRDIPPEWIVKNIELKDLYEGVNAERFASFYYEEKFGIARRWDPVARIAGDYVGLCRELGEEVRIGFNSEGRLRREHDRLALRRNMIVKAEEFAQPLVPEHSRFALLEGLRGEGFEYITETKRLFEEGVNMHNCVYTYRRKVREDRCAILHWKGEEAGPYTIEITDTGRYFRVEQMQTRFNRGCSIIDRQIVEEYLARINHQRGDALEEEVQNVFGGIVEFEA